MLDVSISSEMPGHFTQHCTSRGLRSGSGMIFASQSLYIPKTRLSVVLLRQYIRRLESLQESEKRNKSFFPSCESSCLALSPLPASRRSITTKTGAREPLPSGMGDELRPLTLQSSCAISRMMRTFEYRLYPNKQQTHQLMQFSPYLWRNSANAVSQ